MTHRAPHTTRVPIAQSHYERHFLQSLMARWPRRGRSLVQFGCGHGEILEHFWESGFDVTGVDTEHEHLEAAKERMGHRAEWHMGKYSHTPFDDNEFDYVAVFHVLEKEKLADQEAILKEALRLATRGVLIVVDNPWSLAHWNANNAVNIVQLWRCLRRLQSPNFGLGFMTWGAALHGPKWTWSCPWQWPWHWDMFHKNQRAVKQRKTSPVFSLLNQGYTYSIFGASLFVCLDLGRSHGVTPLLLRTHERARATTVQAYPPTVLGHEKGVQGSSLLQKSLRTQDEHDFS
ncbi:MAG: class I SAM-dependent methyltransferase [Pseudomonadota bacterium]